MGRDLLWRLIMTEILLWLIQSPKHAEIKHLCILSGQDGIAATCPLSFSSHAGYTIEGKLSRHIGPAIATKTLNFGATDFPENPEPLLKPQLELCCLQSSLCMWQSVSGI